MLHECAPAVFGVPELLVSGCAERRSTYLLGMRLAPARTRSGARLSFPPMEQGKVADVTMLLAGLREQVRALDARVVELGRHL
jgi:hypothetical protein